MRCGLRIWLCALGLIARGACASLGGSGRVAAPGCRAAECALLAQSTGAGANPKSAQDARRRAVRDFAAGRTTEASFRRSNLADRLMQIERLQAHTPKG